MGDLFESAGDAETFARPPAWPVKDMTGPPRSTECVRLPPVLVGALNRGGCSLPDVMVAALGGDKVYLHACAPFAGGGDEGLGCNNGVAGIGAISVAGGLGA